MRDPRAILHSQRTSRYAYEGGAFSHSAAHTAVEWRRLASAVARAGDRELWLRYEDLVRDDDALARLAEDLGAEPRPSGEGTSFLDRVAEAERHLHAHVASAPSVDRIDRWRGAVAPRDADLLQEMVREEMAALGYKLEQSSRPSRGAVAASWLRYRVLSACHNLRRHLKTLTQDPRYFLRKMQAKLIGVGKRRST